MAFTLQSQPLLRDAQLWLQAVNGSAGGQIGPLAPLDANCSSITFACPNAQPGRYNAVLVQPSGVNGSAVSSLLSSQRVSHRLHLSWRSKGHTTLRASCRPLVLWCSQVLSIVDVPLAALIGESLTVSYTAVSATFSVMLSAPPKLRATVSLRLPDAEAIITPSILAWAPGQSGVQSFTVQLLRVSIPSLRAQLQAEANVRISAGAAWTSLDLPMPTFRFVPDQVCMYGGAQPPPTPPHPTPLRCQLLHCSTLCG